MGISKENRRRRIQYRIRKKVRGTSTRPRLSVFRSNREIYAQVIDDIHGITLASASSRDNEIDCSDVNKTEVAKRVGQKIAERAKAKDISNVIFDRSGYLYHGRVKALAEGAREGGLQF